MLQHDCRAFARVLIICREFDFLHSFLKDFSDYGAVIKMAILVLKTDDQFFYIVKTFNL